MILDAAHPALTFTLVVVILVLLWIVQQLHMKIQVLESRVDSLDRAQQTVDEELAMVAGQLHHVATEPPARTPIPDASQASTEPPPVVLPGAQPPRG